MNKQIDLTMFSKSKFRMKFKLDSSDVSLLHTRGISIVKKHAKNIISVRLAPASPDRDGKQTPFKGHPVFKAQHATATCCRNCLQKWHHIKKGKRLSEDEIEYIVKFILLWITDQMKSNPKEKDEYVNKQLSLF